MMKSVLLACLLAGAAAHTAEEIQRKGEEVLEEYRKDRGHWVNLYDNTAVDFMVDHVGADGVAVAAFFMTKHMDGKKVPYSAETTSSEPSDDDEIFQQYKQLAKDQSWMIDLGLGHKTWTFGYGFKKSVANAAGCTGIGTRPWNHVCVIVWKTSSNGMHMRTMHTTHFGLDHTKKDQVPEPRHIKNFILKSVGQHIPTHGTGEL